MIVKFFELKKKRLDNYNLFLLYGNNKGFIEETIEKISEAKKLIDQQDHQIFLEVDGGINDETISRVSKAGANVFVAGSAIFGASDYEKTIQGFRQKIT